MGLIIGNTVVLLIGYFDQPELLDEITGQANNFFNYFFTMELILKLLAFGFDYFKDGWNSFDFIIVAGEWHLFFKVYQVIFCVSYPLEQNSLWLGPIGCY